MELRLAFAGFGSVAREFVRMLEEARAVLREQYELAWRITGVATKHHGAVISSVGFDGPEAARLVEEGGSLRDLAGASAVSGALEMITATNADVLFEVSPLSLSGGEPAVSHIRRALELGRHVVTANKGPVAFAYEGLRDLANARRRAFQFEGTVMDGTPVFNMTRHCLPGVRVLGLIGVLNSTSNVVLAAMEAGRSLDAGLEEARRLGIAEANADYDVDGWDAAVKLVVLARVLMGAQAEPSAVKRIGIREMSFDDLARAGRNDEVIRLVGAAEMTGDGVELVVEPRCLPRASLFGSITGTTNALVLKTDLMGEIAVVEYDPGVRQTAYALLSDLLLVATGIEQGRLTAT